MADITYVEPNGVEHRLDVPTGYSVMEGAVKNGVPGILADCGGACSCATCHVYIDAAWVERVGGATEDEDAMLDFVEGRRDNSRLSCQIEVTDSMDGLRVEIPEGSF